MSKSKKRLIDADKFKEEIEKLETELWFKPIHYPYTYSTDPISSAIHHELHTICTQIDTSVKEIITHLIRNISYKIELCIYEDHPCLLCRDDENIQNLVEEYGDIRPLKTDNH